MPKLTIFNVYLSPLPVVRWSASPRREGAPLTLILMCAGIMTMFAPPSLLGLCYIMWERGYSSAVQRRAVQQSTATCDCSPSNL